LKKSKCEGTEAEKGAEEEEAEKAQQTAQKALVADRPDATKRGKSPLRDMPSLG
jgi:hypothetical protein